MKLISLLFILVAPLISSMLISAGGYDVSKSTSQYTFKHSKPAMINVNISEVLCKQSPNVNSITMWITKDWEECWYDVDNTQKELIDKGYTPVFLFYWFADEVSVEFVKKNEKAYFKTMQKFLKYLKKLHGKKIVVLNPEYNMAGVGEWDGMNDIFLKSYEILREDPQVIVGPCVGDFGDYSKTNEPNEWKCFDKSLQRSIKKADFIAFQEMRALTKNTKQEILNTPKRSLNFAQYLKKTYHKPTMLSYLAISTYGKDGDNIQADVYKEYVKLLPLMQEKGDLLLFGTFHYFDYPGHVGYFNTAEEYFGLLKKDGTPKPSLEYYNKLH